MVADRPAHHTRVPEVIDRTLVRLDLVERWLIRVGAFALPLAFWWAHSRTLRFADGPDEVHRRQIGRLELRKHS